MSNCQRRRARNGLEALWSRNRRQREQNYVQLCFRSHNDGCNTSSNCRRDHRVHTGELAIHCLYNAFFHFARGNTKEETNSLKRSTLDKSSGAYSSTVSIRVESSVSRDIKGSMAAPTTPCWFSCFSASIWSTDTMPARVLYSLILDVDQLWASITSAKWARMLVRVQTSQPK